MLSELVDSHQLSLEWVAKVEWLKKNIADGNLFVTEHILLIVQQYSNYHRNS